MGIFRCLCRGPIHKTVTTMNSYPNRIVCPLCGGGNVYPLLADVRISAEIGEGNVSAAVVAWRCTEGNHVFFLRCIDLSRLHQGPSVDEQRVSWAH